MELPKQESTIGRENSGTQPLSTCLCTSFRGLQNPPPLSTLSNVPCIQTRGFWIKGSFYRVRRCESREQVRRRRRVDGGFLGSIKLGCSFCIVGRGGRRGKFFSFWSNSRAVLEHVAIVFHDEEMVKELIEMGPCCICQIDQVQFLCI